MVKSEYQFLGTKAACPCPPAPPPSPIDGVPAAPQDASALLELLREMTPGDIGSEPSASLIFNAPFDSHVTVNVRVTNKGEKRIGWAIKTTSKKLKIEPACGVMDPKEQKLLSVTCSPFDYESEDTQNDRITIKWTNCPTGACGDKKFQLAWFQGSVIIGRHVLACTYNV